MCYSFLFLINYMFAQCYGFIHERNSGFAPLNDNGQPLLLTPYIWNGEIEAARKASKVGDLEDVSFIPSYSGFLTVSQEYNSNMFFWFFPSTSNDRKAPVILWLQGGPGASGFGGLFLENGPYVVYANNSIGLREFSWTQNFHVIYVDNPVGSGFSFTDHEKGYATNQKEVTDGLFEFLLQFFTIYYEYKNNDFYISGESYGGKYATSLAHRIHIRGPSSNMNLKGVTIGNGFMHPPIILNSSDFYFQIGFLDYHQASEIRNITEAVFQNFQNFESEDTNESDLFVQENFFPDVIGKAFIKYTGYTFFYNFLYTHMPAEYSYFRRCIPLPQFRKAIHVGDLPFHDEQTVKKYLRSDVLKSVEDEVIVVMNNYKILFYNGQLDLAVPYVPTIEFLRSLQWKYAKEYQVAKRQLWKINGHEELAGYIHNVRDFYHALVLGAGHLVPHDKPKAGFDLITRFIYGTLVT